jgi:hypothetical protein
MRLGEPSRTCGRPCRRARRAVAVENDHVVVGVDRALHGCGAVVDHVDGESRVAQTLGDPVGQRDVIFHDQHPHLHIVRPAG